MVQAIINVDEFTNRILNMVKAKYALKDKSQAINKMAQEYAESVLEPALRPEYVEKATKIMKQKAIEVGSIENLKKRYAHVRASDQA